MFATESTEENLNEELNENSSQEVVESGESDIDAKKEEPIEVEKDWKAEATYYAAEIQNLKRSFERDKADLLKYGNERILKSVFPVLDNLYLALKATEGAEQDEALKSNKLFQGLLKGVEMTATHFEQTLQQLGVELIEAEGQEFDPVVHEAMGQQKDEKHKDNHVLQVFQKGFKLNGRMVRPAKVIVNKLDS